MLTWHFDAFYIHAVPFEEHIEKSNWRRWQHFYYIYTLRQTSIRLREGFDGRTLAALDLQPRALWITNNVSFV